jgi:hypothetical protein
MLQAQTAKMKARIPGPFRPTLNDWAASLPFELVLDPFDHYDVMLPLCIIKRKRKLAECKLLSSDAVLSQDQVSGVLSTMFSDSHYQRELNIPPTVRLCLAGIYSIPANSC